MMKEEYGTVWQSLGAAILALTIGVPALEQTGFGGFLNLSGDWSLKTCLLVATIGGSIGGALLADKNYVAGLFGGFVAGPCGFLTVYLYCLGLEDVSSHEFLVLIQIVGSLPGIGLYFLLKRPVPLEPFEDEDFDEGRA